MERSRSSTALTESVNSDSSYGRSSEISINRDVLPPSDLSLGLNEKAPLLCNGTKLSSGTIMHSWISVMATLRGPQRQWATVIAALIVAICPLLSGYTLGYPSCTLLELKQSEFGITNTSVMQDLFGSLAPLGAVFGGAAAGGVMDFSGRKLALLFSALPNVVGWLMLALANLCSVPVGFQAILLIGRFCTGFAAGWSLLCAPVYIAEIASPTLRGLYSAVTQIALAIGILLVYSLGSIPVLHYNVVALVAVAITTIFVLLMVWLPETPQYLLRKERVQLAMKSLIWLRGTRVNSSDEIYEMQAVMTNKKQLSCLELSGALSQRKVWVPLIIMVFVMAFQQFCGINSFVFFAAEILSKAEFGTKLPYIALLAIGVTELIFTIVTAVTVDLLGRKVLLIVSGLVMMVSCFLLGVYFYLQDQQGDNVQSIAVISIISFMAGFALGWGAVPWTLVSEIFPLQHRGFLGGISSAVNWLCAALVTGFYFEYATAVTAWGAWLTFGLVNAVAVLFVAVFVPETKGKPLEIIEQEMEGFYRTCVWK